MGTSFVNRYFDDLELCFNLSTVLASFPGNGFNFYDHLTNHQETYNVDTQIFSAHKFETKLHAHNLMSNVS